MAEGAPRQVAGDLWIRDGRIAAIGEVPEEARQGARLDASGCVILPGFVQTHLHLVQTLFRGEAEGLSLLPWLRTRIWPLEAAHNEQTLRASARLGLFGCIESGATTVFDMGTTHGHGAVLEELVASGIRAWSGKALMDLDLDGSTPERLRETTNRALSEAAELARQFDRAGSGRVRYAYAPRFALSATPELHQEVARLAHQNDRRVHTHANETPGEVEACRQHFGNPCVAHLARNGLGTGRWTLAHCVHLEPSEFEALAATRSGVAHCPSSNLKLGSGIADVARLRRHRIAVGLGSDGAPCNNRLDFFREMSLASLLPRRLGDAVGLDAWTTLALATREGAAAIGMEQEIGTLEVGKRADVVVIDLCTPNTTPHRDLATAIVHGASPSQVRDVLVDGQFLKRNFQVLGYDTRELCARGEEALTSLLSRAGLAG